MTKYPDLKPEILAWLFPATYGRKGAASSSVMSDDTDYTLKKCPFCGGKGILTRNDLGMFRVHCAHCGVVTKNYRARELALALWNGRKS